MKKILSTIIVTLGFAGSLFAAPPLITSVEQIAKPVRNEIVATAPVFIALQSSVAVVNSKITAIGIATATLRTDLTTESGTRAAADAALGVSTGALRVDVDALIASTGAFITTELDPVFSASDAFPITAAEIAQWNSAITAETDPVFSASDAFPITAAEIAQWNSAITAETDPVFSASDAFPITAAEIAQWNSAITAETDPIFSVSEAFNITPASTTLWNSAITAETDPIFSASDASAVTAAGISNWDTAYGWGDHATVGYLTSETDPIFSASDASAVTAAGISNWDTAYGWGDHAGLYMVYPSTFTLNGGVASSLDYPFETINSSFSAGVLSSNGYPTIFWKAPSGKLVLGCNSSNGECGSTDVNSEGLVISYPSLNSVGRLKADSMYLAQATDTGKRQVSISKSGMYYQNYQGTLAPAFKLFEITAVSSTTAIAGTFKYNDGNEALGKVLTSDASGIASWATVSASSADVYLASNQAFTGINTFSSNVGIGSTNPTSKLDIVTSAGSLGETITNYGSFITNTPSLNFRKSRGTELSPLAVTLNSILGSMRGYGFDGSWASTLDASIDFIASNTFSPTSHPTRISFKTTAENSLVATERVVISSGGLVGIGTTAPTQTLDVAGSVNASSYFGDGSNLTGILGDNLGNHVATTSLDMASFPIIGLSSITLQGTSLSITDVVSGSNADYGISIGAGNNNNYNKGTGVGGNAINNYDSGVGIGYGASTNFDHGVGVGEGASTNHELGVGIGYSASTNRYGGVGVGYSASGNASRGVGVGYQAQNNSSYGVGIGYGASGNSTDGVGIGSYSSGNSDNGVGIGSQALGNATYAVGVGAYSQNNEPYSTAAGAYSHAHSSSSALGYYAQATNNEAIALGAGAVASAYQSVAIGAYCSNSTPSTVKIKEGYTLVVDSITTTGSIDASGSIGGGVYTLAEMDSLAPFRAGLTITISNSSAPYSDCKSTGTLAGSWVLMNTTTHCQ